MSNTYSVPKSDSAKFIEPQIISITEDLTSTETEKYSNLTRVLTSGEISSEERRKSLAELGGLMTSEPDKYFSYMSQFVIKVEEKTRTVPDGIQKPDENIPAYTTLDDYRMITLMTLNENASIQNKKEYIKSQVYALMILSEARILNKIPEELKRKI